MEKIKKIHTTRFFPGVVIFTVWLLFAFPAFLLGLIPFPSDYQVAFFAPWSAYPELFTPVKNESMPDIIGQIYPWRYFSIESWKNLIIPLWNPYSFGGTPHLANYQSAVLSPLNIGFFIFPFINWWSMLILLQPLFAGLFMYFYMRSVKVGKVGSIISSLSFMFCGFITSWMAYGTLAYAILYIPLTLYAIEKYFENRGVRYLILVAATIPLSFFSGHFQMSLYFLIFIFAYSIYKCVSTKKILCFVQLSFTIFCGLLLCAPQLFPSVELYLQSFRSTLFQKIEVIPWAYIVTGIAPDFYGNPVTRNAWFGHYAEWNLYIGLVPLFLGFYSMFYIKKKYILFFSLAAIITLLCAFQSPLLDLLVASKIPVLSTSALSRIIILTSFSLAVLAGFGYDFLLKDLLHKNKKRIYTEMFIFIGIFALLWGALLGGFVLDSEKISIAKSNLRLPTTIFGAFLVILLFHVTLRKRLLFVFPILLIIIIAFDMLRFVNKWIPFEPISLAYPEVGVTKEFKKISGYDRVFANFGAEGSVYYGLPMLEGYDAVYIRRFGQFIASLDSGNLQDSARSGVDIPLASKNLLPAANLLGIKYFVHKVSDGQNVWEFPFWQYDPKTVKLRFDDGKYQILENTNAYPRAFMVDNVIIESDPQKILNVMFDKKTDLKTTAFIEKKHTYTTKFASGSANILSYSPNRIEIQTNVPPVFCRDSASLLVLTDVYYPGWKAYVYGEHGIPYELEIYRTNFAFRGVFVPDQSNRITFIYDPISFRYGVYAAIIGIVGIVILCFLLRKKKKIK